MSIPAFLDIVVADARRRLSTLPQGRL